MCGSCFLPCRWAWRCLQCILSSRSIIRSTNVAELQTQRNLSNGSPFKHYRFQIRSGYAPELDTITPKHYNAKPGSRQLTSRRRMLMSRIVRFHDQETSTHIIPRSTVVNIVQRLPFPCLRPIFYTSAMSPIPIVVCGRHPTIAKTVREGIQPEYDGTLKYFRAVRLRPRCMICD